MLATIQIESSVNVLACNAKLKLASGVWLTHLQMQPEGNLGNHNDNCIGYIYV